METAPSCCTFYGSAHAGSIQFISHIVSIGVLRNSACELPESGTCFPASRTACKVASPSTNRNLSATCSWRLLDTRWLSGAKNTKRPSNILESHHNIRHENHLLFFTASCWFRCVSLRLHFKRNPSVLQTWATSAHRGIEAGFPTCSAVPSLSTPVPGARSTTSHYKGWPKGPATLLTMTKPSQTIHLHQSHHSIPWISADPVCSRGSASEEKLPAARGKNLMIITSSYSNQQGARSKKQEVRKQLHAARGKFWEAWVSSLELVSCGFRSWR